MRGERFQWGIFQARLDPVLGSEQAGRRPVLVVSNEVINQALPIVTVLPLTSMRKGRRIYSTEVLLVAGQAGLPRDSIVGRSTGHNGWTGAPARPLLHALSTSKPATTTRASTLAGRASV